MVPSSDKDSTAFRQRHSPIQLEHLSKLQQHLTEVDLSVLTGVDQKQDTGHEGLVVGVQGSPTSVSDEVVKILPVKAATSRGLCGGRECI